MLDAISIVSIFVVMAYSDEGKNKGKDMSSSTLLISV